MRRLNKEGSRHSGLRKYVTSIDSCLNGLKYLNWLLLEGLLQSPDCYEQERHVGRVVPAAVTPTSATVSCRSPSRYKSQFQLYLNHNHNHNHKIPKSILPRVTNDLKTSCLPRADLASVTITLLTQHSLATAAKVLSYWRHFQTAACNTLFPIAFYLHDPAVKLDCIIYRACQNLASLPPRQPCLSLGCPQQHPLGHHHLGHS